MNGAYTNEPDTEPDTIEYSAHPHTWNIAGKTIEEHREEARAKLAMMLLITMAILIGLSILIAALLLWRLPEDRFNPKDMLNLILAVGSVFSGLLGAAITFYFSAKQ